MASHHEKQLTQITTSNRVIRVLVQRNINVFLQLYEETLKESEMKDLTIFHESQSEKIQSLRLEQLKLCASSNKTPLAFCGENSSGKTAFIHLFLGIGKTLASGDGPITARITKLTYATGDQACIRVYKNIRERILDEPEVSLAPFFAGDKPNWMAIANTVSTYIKRPKGMDEKSEEFDRWARCLVEIHLPSPILAQGIDVYDTPGFLIGDAPVLTENLHDLVELIHPTIVFMYGNPSTDDGTKSCFVAMKAALHNIDRTSLFFLNSKADLKTIDHWNEEMTREEFSSVLAEERSQRYQLLLRAPFLSDATLEGLPASIDQCSCFDICSTTWQFTKPCGPMMNETAIQRIIQWVVDGHSIRTVRGSQLILPMVDTFFDFLMKNQARTPDELFKLKSDAMAWASRCYQAFSCFTDRALTEVFSKISERFDRHKSPIATLFHDVRIFTEVTSEQILGAVHLAIIRPALHFAVTDCMANLRESIRSSPDLHLSFVHNALLVEALCIQEISDFTASIMEGHHSDKGLLYMVNTISTPIIACLSMVENNLWKIDIPVSEMNALSDQAGGTESRANREAGILRVLTMCQEKLKACERRLRAAVENSGRKQEKIFRALIEEHYNPDSPRLTCRLDTFNQLHRNSGRLMSIACELQTAQDMARFAGEIPHVHGDVIQSSVSPLFTVDWGAERSLNVKRLTFTLDQSNAVYQEVHYHRRVARLQHPHIFNLRYLYQHSIDDQTSELWMIFPPIFSTVNEYIRENLSLSVKQLLTWMVSVADALQTLHNHGLVHGSVGLRNIVLTEDGKVLLAHRVDEKNVIKRHDSANTAAGMAQDMKEFSILGKLMRSFTDSRETGDLVLSPFRDLMITCERFDDGESITAEFAYQKLQSMLSTL